MTPLEFTLVVLAAAFGAGTLGSLLGLGGGVVVIPVLTLLLGVDIRLAIAASAIAVVATSASGATENVRTGLANLRLAAFLELGAAAGALTGAFLSGVLAGKALFVIFGAMLAVSGVVLLRKSRAPALAEPEPAAPDRLRLGGVSLDDDGRPFCYRVRRPGLGLALIYLAGLFGGMLGVGAGVLKVPALDVAMKVPWRASTATSAVMIGVTAAASAGVFLGRGDVAPIVAAPVAVGVVLGAQAGSRLARIMPSWATRALFLGVVAWVSVQMIRKGLA